MVHSRSTCAITISPSRGSTPRSTSKRSPGKMPASIMDSPSPLSRYEAALLVMRYSSSVMVSVSSSSAGEGKPAVTVPNKETAEKSRLGSSVPAAFLLHPFVRYQLLHHVIGSMLGTKPNDRCDLARARHTCVPPIKGPDAHAIFLVVHRGQYW